MNKKKTIIAAFILLLIAFIGGTIAYLTDTDSATNVFTLGNIDITLTEPSWVATNAQNIMPGAEIDKDPQINNVGTAGAYVFIKVEEPCYAGNKLFSYTAGNDWAVVGTAGTCAATGLSTATTVYGYESNGAMAELAANASTSSLFTEVTLDNTLTSTDIAGITTALNGDDLEIVVTGYGIQSAGLGSTVPATVWANFS